MDLKNLISKLSIKIIDGTAGGFYSWIAEGGDIELTGEWSRWDGCSEVDVWDNGELSCRLSDAEAQSLNEHVGDAIKEGKEAFFESLAYDARSRGIPLEDLL